VGFGPWQGLFFVRPGERSGGLFPLYSLFFPSLPVQFPVPVPSPESCNEV